MAAVSDVSSFTYFPRNTVVPNYTCVDGVCLKIYQRTLCRYKTSGVVTTSFLVVGQITNLLSSSNPGPSATGAASALWRSREDASYLTSALFTQNTKRLPPYTYLGQNYQKYPQHL